MSALTNQIGWSDSQVKQWFTEISQAPKRSYQQDIVSRLHSLPANLVTLEQYGTLQDDIGGHPLFRVMVGDLSNDNPTILITSGVHGYEPSGIEASINFLENDALSLKDKFNFVVYPCISPWSYEFDHRWNNLAQDPNRCFSKNADIDQIDECTYFMESIENANFPVMACALDLHETPDRDISLRQERAERFGTELASDFRVIPDGFYLIMTETGDKKIHKNKMLFGKAVIDTVKDISPIATHAKILGKENCNGIIFSPPVEGTLRTYLDKYAKYVGVTEVYPDHPKITSEQAIKTHISAIKAAMRFVNT